MCGHDYRAFSNKPTIHVIEAVQRFEQNASLIRASACRENAMRFNPERFAREVAAAFAATVARHAPPQTNYKTPVAAE